MLKRIFLISLFISFSLLNSIIYESASLKKFIYGETENTEYDFWIGHIAENIANPGYNQYAPYDQQTAGFGNYVIPSDSDLENWQLVVDAFIQEDYALAEFLIDQNNFPYTIVEFHDTDTDRTYYMLRENLNYFYYDDNNTPGHYNDDEVGAFNFSWGLYIYNPESEYPINVNVVHPNDDYITVPMAVKAFQDWNAAFLEINAVGREVAWTGNEPYYNYKSISDPSRESDHPFNIFYQQSCNKIRDLFNHRELSVQLHSYDWGESHEGYANCQISAGKGLSADLPIRDHSSLKQDMVNVNSPQIYPENQFGVHEPVYLNDYYSVNITDYDFDYSNADTTFAVNTEVDLPGYTYNKQMFYSINSWNEYDVFDPFFHIEMDELPNCYDQTENNYHWFYGIDIETHLYSKSRYFNRTIDYYSLWVDNLTEVIPDMFEMNDNSIPTAPTELSLYETGTDYITINWSPSDSYDFDSYEILYSTEPINQDNYQIIDRTNQSNLACLSQQQSTIQNLEMGNQYYIKIRARDKNNNSNENDNELLINLSSASITSFTASGRDSFIELDWHVSEQNLNNGFNIYRKTPFTDFELLSSWENNPDLEGAETSNINYNYTDHSVSNGYRYTYKISAVSSNDFESFYSISASAQAEPIYKIYTTTNSLIDSVTLGINNYATDGYDEHFDFLKDEDYPPNYIHSRLREENWPNNYKNLQREIHQSYNFTNDVKSWHLQIRSNQISDSIQINLSENSLNQEARFFIKDVRTGRYFELNENGFSYQNLDTSLREFEIFIGLLKPKVDFIGLDNKFYRGGESIDFIWKVERSFQVDEAELYLKNSSDSLFLSNDYNFSYNSMSWTIPEELNLVNCNLGLKLTLNNGNKIEYLSDTKMGFLPQINNYQSLSGWHMISNPFVNNSDITSLLGPGAQLYSFEDSVYQEVDEFYNNNGYWLNSPSGYYSEIEAEYNQDEETVTLQKGWNLISNPHLCKYSANSLIFEFYGVELTYSEAIIFDKISYPIYDYDNVYTIVDTLRPNNSYFIYSFVNDLELIFPPFNPEVSAFTPSETALASKIKVSQNNVKKDEVIIGLSEQANSNYNRFFDLPKPPSIPSDNKVRFFISKSFPELDGIHQFHQCFSSLLTEDIDYKVWLFKVKLNSLEPIIFSSQNINFIENYHLSLLIDEIEYEITNHEEVIIEPDSLTITGKVIIGNEDYEVQTGETEILREGVYNYPNPFRPAVNRAPETISFSIKNDQRVKVDIYNIKGQKVKSLINSHLKAGRYQVLWNGQNKTGKDVATGIYFYKVELKKKNHVNKILLIK